MAHIHQAGCSRRGKQRRLRPFQNFANEFPRYRGKALKELFEAVITLQVIEERFDRHPSSLENRRAPKDLGIDCDQVICGSHTGKVGSLLPPDKFTLSFGTSEKRPSRRKIRSPPPPKAISLRGNAKTIAETKSC